jgi:hypothetical protein
VFHCMGCVRNQSWSIGEDVSRISLDLLNRKCQESIVVCSIGCVMNQSWYIGYDVSGKFYGN